MPNKTISDLKLSERVVPKDPSYGLGTLVGIEKKSGQYLIGYKSADPKFSGAWQNSGGKFLDTGEYTENITKDFTHFYFVPNNLELHSNDSGSDGLTVGDSVEIYCDINGAIARETAKQESKQTRKGTVVGFYENGVPLIYIEQNGSLNEIGSAHSAGLNRNIHAMFDGKLDLSRPAFMAGTDGVSSGWLKQVKKGKKVKTMSTNNSERPAFLEMMKTDMKEAGYRVASKQMVDGTKAAILKIMETKGQGSDRVQALSDLLNTEFGAALIGMMLGVGLNYVPGLSNDSRVQKLSEEFRIGSMATAGNAAFDTIAQHILPVLTNALASLPQEGTAVRVSEQPKVETKEEETETKEEVKEKAMTA